MRVLLLTELMEIKAVSVKRSLMLDTSSVRPR